LDFLITSLKLIWIITDNLIKTIKVINLSLPYLVRLFFNG